LKKPGLNRVKGQCEHHFFNVHVHFSLSVFFLEINIYFKEYGEGRTFSFTCNETVKFQKDDVESSKLMLVDNEITIKDIQNTDEGQYTCANESFTLQKGICLTLAKQ